MIPVLAPAIEELQRNGAPKGERNITAFKLACQYRDQGMTIDHAETELEAWGFKVGLSQNELMAAAKSAYSRPPREPWVKPVKYGLANGFKVVTEDMPVPPMPISIDEQPVEKFLSEIFELGDKIVIERGKKDGDGERPDGRYECRTREEWLELFKGDGLEAWQGDAVGVYISINPTATSTRKDHDVSRFRHCLVEFDKSTIAEQWSIIKKSGLPTSAIVLSGSRSLHAWVVINAKDKTEFDERVAFIYKHLEHAQPDIANKNAARLSRLPGAMRTATGQIQKLVELGQPKTTYLEWKERAMFGDIPAAFAWDELMNFKEANDPTTLLGNRFICQGGSALWVGQSGLGKSVLCIQAALTWANGQSFFGINPRRELKSLIIQAENDVGDVAEACQGALKALGLPTEAAKAVMARVIIVRDCSSTGEAFVDRVRRLVQKHGPDLVWLDPLLAFIGGDLSSQETAGGFLRNLLNPLAMSAGFAWMLMHHTPKPLREGGGYQGADKAYSGFGSSELTNWARAVITLAPSGQDEEGKSVYKLEVSKRGRRSNLGQTAGFVASRPSHQPFVFLKHGDDGLAWHQADEPEKKKAGRPEKVIRFEDYADDLAGGLTAGELQERIMARADVGRDKAVKTTCLWEHGDKAAGIHKMMKNVSKDKAKRYVPIDVRLGHV